MTEQPPLDRIRYDAQALVPAVVQDWLDGTVLMVGFMNQDAVRRTVETQRVHFWSRSRGRLWKKGETSGHELRVKNLFLDCDQDTLLIKAEPVGPTCHTGKRSCFFTELGQETAKEDRVPVDSMAAWGGIIERLYQTILDRKAHPSPQSYVSTLHQGGIDRILKKIVEESGEVALAAKNRQPQEIVHEVADLWFHTLVMLGHMGVTPGEIYHELGRRFGQSGVRHRQEGPEHE